VDARIVGRLRCPVCRDGLETSGRSLRCPAGHTFDLARQGYADLSGSGRTPAGDTAAMTDARAAMLAAGHFAVVAQGLLAALAPDGRGGGLVVDVGAGTGYYLAAVLDARPDDVGLAVDVSKAALRRAARAHPRLGAVRADVWRALPIRDGAATAVLSVFAPRNGAEFDRVLRPGGRVLTVTPVADHLAELRLPVRVDPAKDERLRAGLGRWFTPEYEREVRTIRELSATEAAAIAGMGPSAHHRLPTVPPPGPVTIAVRIARWRRLA
jgi:23S rRNA (guanine745-N1)-methyltransferase